MKKRYIFLMVIGGLAVAPLGVRAGRAIKEKVAVWQGQYEDWINADR